MRSSRPQWTRKTEAEPSGLRAFGDNAGAFLGPLLAVFLLYALHVGIRAIFYLAIIPGLLAFFMVLLVKEQHAAVAAKSKIDVSLRQFPKATGSICW
jgi:MFS family permease